MFVIFVTTYTGVLYVNSGCNRRTEGATLKILEDLFSTIEIIAGILIIRTQEYLSVKLSYLSYLEDMERP